MFGNYYQVRAWLEQFIPYTYSKKNLGLDRIRYLLALLGNPQNKFKSIHIAGTSGKGSTAFYLARLLQGSSRIAVHSSQKKIKVGLHVSPHLAYIGERMQINGKAVGVRRLVRLFNETSPMVEAMKDSKVGSPSYFEILVAASFLYFAQERVNWAVVEVGLGGRLDATNVLRPEVAVITNVGLDHEDILGKSIEKIAWEKAGIIKPKIPIVTATSGKALQMIKKVAKSKRALLITLDTQTKKKLLESDILTHLIIYRDIVSYSNRSFVLSNLLLAILTLKALKIPLTKNILRSSLKSSFEGRFEEIVRGVILDGAHNPDKIRALLNFIGKSKVKSQKSKVILVVGFKRGKDWQKMVDLLVENLSVEKVIATQFQAPTDTGFFEAVPAKEIAEYLTVNCQPSTVNCIENSQEAVFEALQSISGSSTLVLITGSLYLAGEVRTMWHLPEYGCL